MKWWPQYRRPHREMWRFFGVAYARRGRRWLGHAFGRIICAAGKCLNNVFLAHTHGIRTAGLYFIERPVNLGIIHCVSRRDQCLPAEHTYGLKLLFGVGSLGAHARLGHGSTNRRPACWWRLFLPQLTHWPLLNAAHEFPKQTVHERSAGPSRWHVSASSEPVPVPKVPIRNGVCDLATSQFKHNLVVDDGKFGLHRRQYGANAAKSTVPPAHMSWGSRCTVPADVCERGFR